MSAMFTTGTLSPRRTATAYVRGLPAALVLTRHRPVHHVLHWSQWRRRHYQRRSQP
ncbi:hypothetical protein AB0G15_24705 [Streptosporangium sp. NPDC023825]|uniref:hypothetical protein n=1 Tax=Streptosporangium sp. NPDC023825 TaxID=3154909 RepID=UPI00343A9FCA